MTQARTMNITILTVCVEPVLAERVLSLVDQCDWAITHAAFDTYMSDKRRPHFGENLRGGDGCLAILDFARDPRQAVEAVAHLQSIFGERLVVAAISPTPPSPELMLEAMHAGCTEFLTEPLSLEAIRAACGRIEQHFLTKAVGAGGTVVAFFGAKGGVGATTLAVHLATYLVQNNHKRVLLIDNHSQFGHACIYLGIDGSRFQFQELVRNVNRLDSELLLGFLAKHSSGLDMLSSPDVAQNTRAMHADDVASTLDFLRGEYDYVVVDCVALMDETNLAVMAAASQVFVVATPEISAIRDLSRMVDDLTRIDPTANKIKVIINRFQSQFAISLEEIERAIRLPVCFSIPNSFVELVRSVNLGVPVAHTAKSPFTEVLVRWADSLVGVEATKPAGAGRQARRSPLQMLKSMLKPSPKKVQHA